MIRRTRAIATTLGLLLVLGLLMGGLALSRFSDDPVALLFERRERVVIPLPESGGRLVLVHSDLRPLTETTRRHIALERAGQPLVETDLFDAAQPGAAITVHWLAATPEAGGPYARLVEPGGEILIDTVNPGVARVLRTAVGPILTSPKGDARVGAVIGPDDAVTITHGLSGDTLPRDKGKRLGVVEIDESGAMTYHPDEPPAEIPDPSVPGG